MHRGRYRRGVLLAAFNDTPYKIVLVLHIVFVFAAFASMFVHPFVNAHTAGHEARSFVFAEIAKRSVRIHSMALIVGGLLGFALAGMSDDGTGELVYRVRDGWILAAVAVWVAMNGVLHAMIVPAEKAIAAGDESKTSRLSTGFAVTSALFLVMMYLMVFKPGA